MKVYVEVQTSINVKRMEEMENLQKEQQQQQQNTTNISAASTNFSNPTGNLAA